jgi:succinate dehydrogenase / fumarate reductase cytochrome b subunit
MNGPVVFYRSTIGKKIIMAVTGLIGVGFVIAHMAGNLQVFVGREKMNAYAAFLHGPAAELLWVARLVLVGAVVLHVLMAWQLTRRARAARPVAYGRKEPQAATLASRLMRWGGVLLLVFIVLHILHFTTGTIRPGGEFVPGDVYGNVVWSFRIWWVTLFYVAAMVALGLHIFHGAWSSMRTLGVARPSPRPLHRTVSLILAIVLWLGFTIVPLAVFAGFVR